MKKKLLYYPGHGVCQRMDDERRVFQGETVTFAVIKTLRTGMVYHFYKMDMKRSGIRPLITKTAAKKLMVRVVTARLGGGLPFNSRTWSAAYNQSHTVMHGGDPVAILEVVQVFAGKAREYDLTFAERKIFDFCKALLTEEISAVLGVACTI